MYSELLRKDADKFYLPKENTYEQAEEKALVYE